MADIPWNSEAQLVHLGETDDPPTTLRACVEAWSRLDERDQATAMITCAELVQIEDEPVPSKSLEPRAIRALAALISD